MEFRDIEMSRPAFTKIRRPSRRVCVRLPSVDSRSYYSDLIKTGIYHPTYKIPKKGWSIVEKLFFIFFLLLISASMYYFITFYFVFSLQTVCTNQFMQCLSPNCMLVTQPLVNSINKSRDPCSNISAFVCENKEEKEEDTSMEYTVLGQLATLYLIIQEKLPFKHHETFWLKLIDACLIADPVQTKLQAENFIIEKINKTKNTTSILLNLSTYNFQFLYSLRIAYNKMLEVYLDPPMEDVSNLEETVKRYSKYKAIEGQKISNEAVQFARHLTKLISKFGNVNQKISSDIRTQYHKCHKKNYEIIYVILTETLKWNAKLIIDTIVDFGVLINFQVMQYVNATNCSNCGNILKLYLRSSPYFDLVNILLNNTSLEAVKHFFGAILFQYSDIKEKQDTSKLINCIRHSRLIAKEMNIFNLMFHNMLDDIFLFYNEKFNTIIDDSFRATLNIIEKQQKFSNKSGHLHTDEEYQLIRNMKYYSVINTVCKKKTLEIIEVVAQHNWFNVTKNTTFFDLLIQALEINAKANFFIQDECLQHLTSIFSRSISYCCSLNTIYIPLTMLAHFESINPGFQSTIHFYFTLLFRNIIDMYVAPVEAKSASYLKEKWKLAQGYLDCHGMNFTFDRERAMQHISDVWMMLVLDHSFNEKAKFEVRWGLFYSKYPQLHMFSNPQVFFMLIVRNYCTSQKELKRISRVLTNYNGMQSAFYCKKRHINCQKYHWWEALLE